ncbi:MAG: hypothetical protein ACREGG_02045 [Candidatus Saccharimonadales bacterium]
MRKILNLITTYLSLAAIVLVSSPLFWSSPASAATTPPAATNSGQALEIAPPVITLTANPGQTLKTQILLRDISSSNLIVTSQTNDFVAAGEDGTPKVILDNNTPDPYSMRTWVVPPASLNLAPREIQPLSVTINVPATASPGGHYAVVRFTGTAPSLSGTGVSLSASLGALILLTVNGKITHNLSLASFTVSKGGKTGSIFQSGPLDFTVRLKNNGNVHELPVGQITIKDMFGKKLATTNVNLPPKNVLPSSIRKFDSSLDSSVIGTKKLFGHYKATLTVTYAQNQKLTGTLSFWVIPYRLIAIIIVIIIALFFGLRYAIRRYNRYIITRTNRRPPPPGQ